MQQAADWMDGRTHNKTFLYAITEAGISTYGHKTSNIVESVNGVFVNAREEAPLKFFMDILLWVVDKGAERREKATAMESNPKFTTAATVYGTNLHNGETVASGLVKFNRLAFTAEHVVEFFREHHHQTPSHVVNLQTRKCCSWFRDHQMPCRHIQIVKRAQLMEATDEEKHEFILKFMNPAFLQTSYHRGYRHFSCHRPVIQNGIIAGVTDARNRLNPPLNQTRNTKLGRPAKERMRSAGHGSKDGGHTRKKQRAETNPTFRFSAQPFFYDNMDEL
jgi:hypothetical protein